MSEPRFPPPHGEEPVGYREAGAPVSDEKPELPIPSGEPLPRGKRVVASRPDDPDIALAKANYPPKSTRAAKASTLGTVIVVVLIFAYVVVECASTYPWKTQQRTPQPPRTVTQ